MLRRIKNENFPKLKGSKILGSKVISGVTIVVKTTTQVHILLLIISLMPKNRYSFVFWRNLMHVAAKIYFLKMSRDNYYIAKRNRKILSCLRPGHIQRILTRAVRQKQSVIFLAWEPAISSNLIDNWIFCGWKIGEILSYLDS